MKFGFNIWSYFIRLLGCSTRFLECFVIILPFLSWTLNPWPHYNLCEDLLILGAVLSTCGDLCWGVSIWCQWFFHLSSDILSWDHVKKFRKCLYSCYSYVSYLFPLYIIPLTYNLSAYFELARKSERRKSEYPCEIFKFLFVRSMHRYLSLLG